MTKLRFEWSRGVMHTKIPGNYLKINPSPLALLVTIFLVGQSLAAMLSLETLAHLAHPAIWLSLTLVLTSLLLPRLQGPAAGACRAHTNRG